MKPRVTHALFLLLLPLVLQAVPAGAEAGLPVLEPVGVSGYSGEEGQGLRLSFKRLEDDGGLCGVEAGRQPSPSLVHQQE